MKPTKEELLWFYNYDSEHGVLSWRNHYNKTIDTKLKGKIVGNLDLSTGYLVTRLKRKAFKIHQIIWCMEKGTWAKYLDHIDGNKTNNRIENLREVTHRENMQNLHYHRNGRLVGTGWHKGHQKWRAYISTARKQTHLGYFNTEIEAHQTYLKALSNV